LSNVWHIERNGEVQTVAIRTTRNRWFAFPPLAGGTKWKTLDDVDLVVVAAVDSPEKPENVEVYIFRADEVRERFNAALAARKKAGQTIRDDFGMWIALDAGERDIPSNVGSGLAQISRPVATFSLTSLSGTPDPSARKDVMAIYSKAPHLTTIADVMEWARQRVAEIAGVHMDAVKLDLKIGY